MDKVFEGQKMLAITQRALGITISFKQQLFLLQTL